MSMRSTVFIALLAVSGTAFAPSAARAQDTPQAAPHTAPQATHDAQLPPARALPLPEPRGWDFSEAGLIPVQNGGRIKPLDSFARDIVLFTTGSRSFEGWNPVELVFSWLAFPEAWEEAKIVQVSRVDVKRQLGLEEKRTRFAPHELVRNASLGQYAREMMGTMAAAAQSGGQPKLTPREQELKRVLDRISLFRNIVSGDGWPVIPVPPGNGAEAASWGTLGAHDSQGELIRDGFMHLFRAYQKSDHEAFALAATLTRTSIESQVPGWGESLRRTVAAEAFYNRARPFLYAWIFYLTAALLWVTLLARAGILAPPAGTFVGLRRLALAATGLGFLCHVTGIAMRCYVAGRPPVTNMYESVIWVSLGQLVFASILYFFQRQPIMLTVATVLATFGLIAGDSAPAIMDPGIHPLVPVLRSNYWLTIHVLTITLGYAAFFLTLGLGNVTLFQFARLGSRVPDGPAIRSRITTLNQLTYRAMMFGVVLLAAGTILGGVWADYSWGRFWGWDPKEVWALIALLCYVAILHGRYAGWITQFGYAAWTVIAFSSVMMAWYGVNFVLGVGLHSYGFSSGGTAWVAGGVGVQLLYVGLVTLLYKRVGQAPRAATPAPAAG
jgi:cytochrome c-type biogenesis protein CcsB